MYNLSLKGSIIGYSPLSCHCDIYINWYVINIENILFYLIISVLTKKTNLIFF